MSELAFNYKGQRFAPPSGAAYWRVRRIRDGQRGQLDVVRDGDGLPLILPIDIGIEGFREAVNDQMGRYRLDALDDHKMGIAEIDAAYVDVPQPAVRRVAPEISDPAFAVETMEAVEYDDAPLARAGGCRSSLRNGAPSSATVTGPFGTWPALPSPVAMSGVEYLLGEALRGQTHTQTAQLDRLTTMLSATLAAQTQMMTAAAELLRAADGAAMPRRDPPPAPPVPPPPAPAPAPPPIVLAMPRNAMPPDGEEDYDDEESDEDGLDDAPIETSDEGMIDKLNKLVEKVGMALTPVAGVAQMVMSGSLGGLFGGGGAPRNAANVAPAPAEPEPEPDDGPALSHLHTSHIALISHELGGADGSMFRQMVVAMEPADRRLFTERLCAMPLDEAVPFAADRVAWLKARLAKRAAQVEPSKSGTDTRTSSCQAPRFPSDRDEDHEHDMTQHEHLDPNQEHDTTQYDHFDDDSHDTPVSDDDITTNLAPDPERDVTQYDQYLDDTHIPTGDEPARDARTTDKVDAALPPTTTASSLASPTSTPTSIHRATPIATATPNPANGGGTPDVMAHMKAMAKHLRIPEILQAQALISDTSAVERDAWITRLMALSPTDAAATVRAELTRRAGR